MVIDMSLKFICQKLGCSSFVKNEHRQCITLIKVIDGIVLEKNSTWSGDNNYLVGYNVANSANLKKPQSDFCKKKHKDFFCNFLSESRTYLEYSVGDLFDINLFNKECKINSLVNIRSKKTIGKGFSGVVKCYNFAGSPASHGTSLTERAHGSTGQQNSERVFPGKKMAKKLGNRSCTMLNLKITYIDIDAKLVGILGSIPGARNSIISVYKK